ncbi:hypothetical protein C8F04DRAFT_1095186 [Mycena alexandri]|uniref:Uncharacterized protein n=1 Tax=Mycena alexandri TaxID=1745969 RepID=A0AAD6SZE6_9AGAR|nr:hypothetical protein C8F04DRAFT_1095186 [Mycena alexandri]
MPEPQYRIASTNPVPDRPKRVIAEIIEKFKDRYDISHVANIESIDDVRATVERERPNLLFIASSWTPEQAEEIVRIAKEVIPDIKTFNPPRGLQADKGTNAVAEYIEENLPALLDS